MIKLQLLVFSFLLYLSAVISDDVIQVERSDQKVLKFWQISDIHLDQLYNVYGDPAEYCHSHLYNKSNSSHNISNNNSNVLGKFGDFQCEANLDLLHSAFEFMKSENENPDFVVWTGDSAPHWTNPFPSWGRIFSIEKTLVNLFKQYFPRTKFLPVMGNHDSSPPDFFPENENFYEDFLSKSSWDQLLPDLEVQRQFARCGFYKYNDVESNLTFLALNTNLYYKTNNSGPDICGQLTWIRSELEQAVRDLRQVIILSHVPPGFFERDPFGPFFQTSQGDHHYNENFVELIQEFSAIIVAQIYGHTHTDSFRIFCNNPECQTDSSNPTAFIAPSLTPIVNGAFSTNPGVRIYSYQAGKPYLLDYDQFYFDLSKSNQEGKAIWEKIYNFRTQYEVSDLSAVNLMKVYWDLTSNDTLFQQHFLFNTLGHRNYDCNGTCRTDYLCAIINLKTDDMRQCQQQQQQQHQQLGMENMSSKSEAIEKSVEDNEVDDVYDDLRDWQRGKEIRQQLASKVISYIIVFGVFVLILLFTMHLVDMCRKSEYTGMPDTGEEV